MQRPSTAKRFQQLEEDEELARQLQADFNSGTGTDEYHRLNTAKKLEEEFQFAGESEPSDHSLQEEHDLLVQEETESHADFEQKDTKDSLDARSNVSDSASPASKLFAKDETSEDQSYYEETGRIAPSSSVEPSEIESHIVSGNLKKDIQNLLELIDVYKPEAFVPDYFLEAFVPDLIPSIGDIDPMLPVELVDFELRSYYVGQKLGKKAGLKVRSIQMHDSQGREAGLKAIQNWLKTVSDNYAARISEISMSDLTNIEELMSQWPVEIDDALTNNQVLYLIIDRIAIARD
ncbi:hypothetical protein EDD86DRAFT_245165 [Gorgonomyces haynaldii]|nr:hypothetical protein EDD86DRAFT_245165 [Gorgonomyces haynaldii]